MPPPSSGGLDALRAAKDARRGGARPVLPPKRGKPMPPDEPAPAELTVVPDAPEHPGDSPDRAVTRADTGIGTPGAGTTPAAPTAQTPPAAATPPITDAATPARTEPADTPAPPSAVTPPLPRRSPARPAKPSPAPRRTERAEVEWTIHTRNVRSGLMAWVRAVEKVRDREQDLQELLRTIRKHVTDDDLAGVVRVVAAGNDVTEQQLAAALGIALPTGDHA